MAELTDLYCTDVNVTFRPGGLLVGQLDRIMFYESKAEGEFRPHMLPSDGNAIFLIVTVNAQTIQINPPIDIK